MEFKTKDEFFDFYLLEHSDPTCRVLHYIATMTMAAGLIAAIVTGKWLLILTGISTAYVFAWIGHFFFEHNKPASFSYPWASFKSDARMFGIFLSGKIDERMEQARINLNEKHAASLAGAEE